MIPVLILLSPSTLSSHWDSSVLPSGGYNDLYALIVQHSPRVAGRVALFERL
jgi:hypothetical protein